MSEDHPLLVELREKCKQHGLDSGDAHLAFELYIELCEVQKLWDVEHHFNEELRLLYLSGKHNKNNDIRSIYLPVKTNYTLNPEYIERLQTTISSENKSLIFVFKDQDSSSSYYKVSQGLIRPDSPDTAQRKKLEEKKKFQFQRNLEKNKKQLFIKAIKKTKSTLN